MAVAVVAPLVAVAPAVAVLEAHSVSVLMDVAVADHFVAARMAVMAAQTHSHLVDMHPLYMRPR